MQYFWLLTLHGTFRWLVFLTGGLGVGAAWWARVKGRDTGWSRRAGVLFVAVLDTQLLLGLALYLASPLRVVALADPRQALTHETGFFAFLHPALMLGAIGAAHLGPALARRPAPAPTRRRRAAWCLSGSLALILLTVPWWRPLLRF